MPSIVDQLIGIWRKVWILIKLWNSGPGKLKMGQDFGECDFSICQGFWLPVPLFGLIPYSVSWLISHWEKLSSNLTNFCSEIFIFENGTEITNMNFRFVKLSVVSLLWLGSNFQQLCHIPYYIVDRIIGIWRRIQSKLSNFGPAIFVFKNWKWDKIWEDMIIPFCWEPLCLEFSALWSESEAEWNPTLTHSDGLCDPSCQQLQLVSLSVLHVIKMW